MTVSEKRGFIIIGIIVGISAIFPLFIPVLLGGMIVYGVLLEKIERRKQ